MKSQKYYIPLFYSNENVIPSKKGNDAMLLGINNVKTKYSDRISLKDKIIIFIS